MWAFYKTGSGEGQAVPGGVLGTSVREVGKKGSEQMGILLMRWTSRMVKVKINQGRREKEDIVWPKMGGAGRVWGGWRRVDGEQRGQWVICDVIRACWMKKGGIGSGLGESVSDEAGDSLRPSSEPVYTAAATWRPLLALWIPWWITIISFRQSHSSLRTRTRVVGVLELWLILEQQCVPLTAVILPIQTPLSSHMCFELTAEGTKELLSSNFILLGFFFCFFLQEWCLSVEPVELLPSR